jgi:NAD(P)-dependent dehydrogenase (short-subunit alcohol dehydrogenase family)
LACRQLQHGRILAFAQLGDQHDPSAGEFQRIMMHVGVVRVDVPEPSHFLTELPDGAAPHQVRDQCPQGHEAQARQEEAKKMEIGGREVQLGIPDQLRQMAPMLIPLGRPGTPQEAAGGIFFLCSPWSNYVHGQVLNVTGGQFSGMYI